MIIHLQENISVDNARKISSELEGKLIFNKDIDYDYYWSKIFGQYNKDWYGNDQEHILKAHRFLNGWPG